MMQFWISFVCIYRWPPFGPDIIISFDMLISLGLISFGMVFSCMLVGMGSCSGGVPASSARIRAIPSKERSFVSPLFCGLELFSSKARQLLSLQWRIAVDINPVGRLCRHVTG